MSSLPNSEIILQILLSVRIIVIAAKLIGTQVKKIGFPVVAGQIVAGLLLRYLPFFQNFGGGETNIIYREANQFISYMAEIGVILIMYSAGLGTSLKSLIKSGFKATIIACCGVFVPLFMGALMALCFWGFDGFGTAKFYQAMFIGTILTATSVSISVATLLELQILPVPILPVLFSAALQTLLTFNQLGLFLHNERISVFCFHRNKRIDSLLRFHH